MYWLLALFGELNILLYTMSFYSQNKNISRLEHEMVPIDL